MSAVATIHTSRQSRCILDAPSEFICPILNNAVMTEPVISEGTGITFDHAAIVSWQSLRGDVCPVTGGDLGELKPNNKLRAKIATWQQQRASVQCEKKSSVSSFIASGKKNTASSSIASTRLKRRKLGEKEENFDHQVLNLVQFFAEHEMEADKDRMEKKSSRQQLFDHYYPSIFRRGPTLGLPRA
jgi:hypothetical protein